VKDDMKIIMESWRREVLKEQETEEIKTFGDLRNQLRTAISTKKKGALRRFGIGVVMDVLGAAFFKDALTFFKTMYKLPDNKKTGTVLDQFLNVDDQVSAIVDDKIENAFLQDFLKMIEKQPDDKVIDKTVTQELQDYLRKQYKNRTVTT
tara:strand:+ start:888 stop:1337 length:450 start_codon:yes stop_codon:yes gene_type:complete